MIFTCLLQIKNSLVLKKIGCDNEGMRRKAGDIFEISLRQGLAYATALSTPRVAFFDCLFKLPKTDISAINDLPVYCAIWVADPPLIKISWKKVGASQLNENLMQVDRTPLFKNVYPSSKVSKYYPDGHEELSLASECINLEEASIWSIDQAEERLEDHFNGIENINVYRSRQLLKRLL